MPVQSIKLSTDGEPELNVELDDLFVPEGDPLPHDYMDIGSDDTDELGRINKDFRNAWEDEIDRESVDPKRVLDPDKNPAQQVGPYKESSVKVQIRGFAGRPDKKSPVIGRIFIRKNVRTITGSRVSLQHANSEKILQGRVISTGKNEFSVIWEDKKASTEEKKNFTVSFF